MRYIFYIVFALISFVPYCQLNAQHLDSLRNISVETNNWGAKIKESPFGLGLDLHTKYVWRGMEMMIQNSSPVIFPSVNYSWNGFSIYTMGGYAFNGEYAEVDLGVSYTWKSLTIGINDYYYPSLDNNYDSYFAKNNEGHWLETTITYAPNKIPLWITASTFISGADKYVDNNNEQQAYSSYLEVGSYFNFLDNNRVSLTIGTALNRSCYNVYAKGLSICNIEGRYTYNVIFKNDWTLPLSVSYIYNPVFNKTFINFIANIAF